MTAGWARWNASGAPWSVALEEDVRLLRPPGWAPAERAADEVVATLPGVKAGVEATGGTLEIHAVFGDVDIKFTPRATIAAKRR